jgi:hypothetical protein
VRATSPARPSMPMAGLTSALKAWGVGAVLRAYCRINALAPLHFDGTFRTMNQQTKIGIRDQE